MRRASALCLLGLLVSSAIAQIDPVRFQGLEYRSIGPFRGGRSIACAGSDARPNEYFFGATGGGLWKTTDGGKEWSPVTDGFLGSSSVGAVAVSPSNPDVVYIGTGERDIRGNISQGDGAYKSTDSGKTWAPIGLKETQTIGRIVVHPTNPDIVWVAALGPIYVKRDLATGKITSDPNRGVYKSTDGGKTWKRTLFRSAEAGAVHVALDPSDPNVLYAATWEAWRTPYTMNSGGPGSGLFKSTDGGETWKEITRNPGLPAGVIGKIGVDVSRANPKVVWAIVEAAEGGIFRSNDAGATWSKVNDNRNWRQRAWYYSHVIADPKNADSFWVLNVSFGRSTDGGKTIGGSGTTHSDHHDLWVSPTDPNRMIVSNDGGASVSTDGGRNWTEQDYPTAQFYHVSTDNAFPYRVLGAQQDNSTIRIASRTRGFGIGKEDWTSTAGGESGYVVADPTNPDIVFGGSYNGFLERLNHRTGLSRDINAWPENPMGAGAADLRHRIQWTFPIVFSPHDPKVLYTCSQHVMKSTNAGQSWKIISPDLSRNDKRTMGPSGGPITKDNTSVEYYGTVFTLAESPLIPNQLWAGTDDGRVHITRDGGVTWQDVTPKEMPDWGLCSMIEASPFNPGRAILAVDNHENDDLAPYIFITEDFGRTWTKRVTGIPAGAFVRAVREDPTRQGLFYAGTETGVYVSWDGGEYWSALKLNLPVTPIHNLVVKGDDLVLATHGRSFWIFDDLTPIRELTRVDVSTPRVLLPMTAYRADWGGSGAGAGQNPRSQIVANVFLPEAKSFKLTVKDSTGTVVATREMQGARGFQRVSLRPTYPSYRTLSRMVFWAAGPSPILAPPGEFSVTLEVGDRQDMGFVRYLRDPRGEATDAEIVRQVQFAREIAARTTTANEAVGKVRDAREKATAALEKDKSLSKLVEPLLAEMLPIEEAIHQTKSQSGQDPLNYPIRLNNKLAALIGVVMSGDGAPTDSAYEVYAQVSADLDKELVKLEKVWNTRLNALNAALKAKKQPEIVPTPAWIATGGGGRRGGEK
jgi:photosystem II stability/assembly factor-like uncharacterized protein